MQKEWIVLSLHPETTLEINLYWQITKGFVHNAEREFKSIIEQIAQEFPDLKIVVEHISTKENAQLLANWKYENVFWTITPQHLTQTAHDKEGFHWFNTHLHCKPTLKTPKDQEAIWNLILSWNKNIFLGSDSAPHPTYKKEAEYCAAWVFSSPIVLEIITNWFFDPKTIAFWIDNWLLPENWYLEKLQELLQNFVWNNWNQVYWEVDKKFHKKIILEKKDFTIPEYYWNNPEIKPMWAWKTLNYIVSKIINS
jgi:dihydroorotase